MLLGPTVLVRDTGERTRIGGARLRVLLATLLLHANKPVSADALADAVWDGKPPAGAATTLRGHVLRLRRALVLDAGNRIVAIPTPAISCASPTRSWTSWNSRKRCRRPAPRSATWGVGGRLRRGDRGRLRTGRARHSPTCPARRCGTRGYPGSRRRGCRCWSWRIEADLRLGRRDQLVPELRALVADHPLRERFHVQLMLVLAGTGRQAEALAAYQDARRVLIGELGIEPGPELRELQERILAGDSEFRPRPDSP